MRLPLCDIEKGAIYVCGKKSAYFFTLDSAYYNNCMITQQPNATICTFKEFKKKYPILINNNYRCIDETFR